MNEINNPKKTNEEETVSTPVSKPIGVSTEKLGSIISNENVNKQNIEKEEEGSHSAFLATDQSKQQDNTKNGRYNKGNKKRGSNQHNKKQLSSGNENLPKGYLLEYRMKRLLFYMGYFPKVGIDIRTTYDDSSDKITDLDVYGIYVHRNFARKTIWVDCKSGSVQIHDRITWIKGIMGEVAVNDMIFVVNGARTSVKQYARKAGIQLLDLRILDKLEADYNINENDWRGSWNPDTQHNKINQLAKFSIPTNDLYKRIAKYISSDYWAIDDNYSKVKKTLSGIRDLSLFNNESFNAEQNKVIQWAIFELTNLFLLAVLDIAKELYYFNDSEKRETILEGLSSGDIPNRKRKEIFDSAFRVAYSMVKTQIPDFKLPSTMPSFNITPPSYSDAFVDLIYRITNNPMNFYDLLRFLDFTLMEYDHQSKSINENELRTLFKNYDELLVGAKTLVHFICQVTNVPRSFFQLI